MTRRSPRMVEAGWAGEAEYYRAKVVECLSLADANADPLSRDVYRAMASEFRDKAARFDKMLAPAGT